MASVELSNPRAERVAAVRRLASRAFRQQERRFLVEGTQAVREALAGAVAGEVRAHEVFISTQAADRQHELIELADVAGVPVRLATEQVLAALSDTVTPQGIVAVCDFLERPLAQVIAGRPRLVALLAEVRDPGNAGSVLRAADAAGADAVAFSTGSVDPYNGKVVRSSVGGLFHVPIATEVDGIEAIQAMRSAGLHVLAADAAGSVDLDTAERSGVLTKPTVWVLGNEAWGLDDELRGAADEVIRIPIYGRAESLNLATAATLCFYASARAQRAGE